MTAIARAHAAVAAQVLRQVEAAPAESALWQQDDATGLVRAVVSIKATPPSYDLIVNSVADLLDDLWTPHRQIVIDAARDIAEFGDFDQAAEPKRRKAALQRARRRLEKMNADLAAAGAALGDDEAEALGRYMAAGFRLGKTELARPLKFTGVFTLPDRDAIHGMTDAGMFWIRRHFGRAIPEQAMLKVVEEVMVVKGLGKTAGGAALEAAFGAQFAETSTYWRGLAGTMTTRSRSFGALSAMTDAGATVYEYVNPLDERTSPVCRRLDGTQFTVRSSVDLRDRLLVVDDPDEWKRISPWPKERDLLDGVGNTLSPSELQAKGIAWPPLHFHCRSSIDVVVWMPVSRADLDPVGNVWGLTGGPTPTRAAA